MIRAAYVIMTEWRNPRHLIIVWNTEKKSVRYLFIYNPKEKTEAVAKEFLETAVESGIYRYWKTNSATWALKHTETNTILAEIEKGEPE